MDQEEQKIQRLQHIIEFSGLTRSQFAAKLRITEGHLSNLLNGKKSITDRFALVLQAVFNVSPAWTVQLDRPQIGGFSEQQIRKVINSYESKNSFEDRGQRVQFLLSLFGTDHAELAQRLNLTEKLLKTKLGIGEVPEPLADFLEKSWRVRRQWLSHGKGKVFAESLKKTKYQEENPAQAVFAAMERDPRILGILKRLLAKGEKMTEILEVLPEVPEEHLETVRLMVAGLAEKKKQKRKKV